MTNPATPAAEWQMVPKEPTPEMIAAASATPGIKAIDGASTVHQLRGYPLPAEAFADGSALQQAYRAMLRAAPAPVAEPAEGWQTVRVAGLDALFRALERADLKGYLPDAMRDAWNAFDYDPTSVQHARHPTEDSDALAEPADTDELVSDDRIMWQWNRIDDCLHGRLSVIWFARAVIDDYRAAAAAPPAKGEGEALPWHWIWEFLDGSAGYEGVFFGDRHPKHKGAFWWRSFLREALGQMRAAFASKAPAAVPVAQARGPLTPGEIYALADVMFNNEECRALGVDLADDWLEEVGLPLARAVEAAHGIKPQEPT